MANKKRSASTGATDQSDVSSGLDADADDVEDVEVHETAPKTAPANAPPSLPPQKKEVKKVYERQANRPRCKSCGQLMHAKSTPGIMTMYYCTNEDCPSQSGLPVIRKEAVDLLERNRNIQQQSVAARENMKDTAGE